MQEISVKILKQKIVESKIYISEDFGGKLQVNMNCKATLKKPKNLEDKSVLLTIVFNINAKEDLKIELNADVIFEVEELLENYDEIAEKKMIPMACKSLLNSLDDMLVVMGYNKMELAKSIRNQ